MYEYESYVGEYKVTQCYNYYFYRYNVTYGVTVYMG